MKEDLSDSGLLSYICIKAKAEKKKISFANGCFDIIHAGHVQFLKEAKQLAEVVIVGINSDESIKFLKGLDRPLNNLEARSIVLDSIRYVDYVIQFNGNRVSHLLEFIKPDFFVKGGDYTLDKVERGEFDTCMKNKIKIIIANKYGEVSTTNLINKIRS